MAEISFCVCKLKCPCLGSLGGSYQGYQPNAGYRSDGFQGGYNNGGNGGGFGNQVFNKRGGGGMGGAGGQGGPGYNRGGAGNMNRGGTGGEAVMDLLRTEPGSISLFNEL